MLAVLCIPEDGRQMQGRISTYHGLLDRLTAGLGNIASLRPATLSITSGQQCGQLSLPS